MCFCFNGFTICTFHELFWKKNKDINENIKIEFILLSIHQSYITFLFRHTTVG